MLKLSSLRSNLQREYEGDWVAYPDWDDVRFKVRSFGNPDYRAAAETTAKRFAKKYNGERIPDREMYEANGRLLAEHILRGWEGIDQDYTPELAEEMLIDPAYELLNNAVNWCARRIAAVDVQFIKDAEKNSAAPSAIN